MCFKKEEQLLIRGEKTNKSIYLPPCGFDSCCVLWD